MHPIRPVFSLNLTSPFLLLPWLPSSLKIKSQLLAWPSSFSALIPSYCPLDLTGLAILISLLLPGYREHAPSWGVRGALCMDSSLCLEFFSPNTWHFLFLPFKSLFIWYNSSSLRWLCLPLHTHTSPSEHKPHESTSPVWFGYWMGDYTWGQVGLGKLILGVHSKGELSESVINRAQLNLISCTFCSCKSGGR